MTAFHLTDKNIVVTGASSGLGRQIAISCSQMGARVILVARDKQRLQETLEQMQNPAIHSIISIDITSYNELEQALLKEVELNGKINGLVNCAGISSTLPIRSVTPEKLNSIFTVNVFAAFQLTRIVSTPRYVSAGGASFVFISSVAGMVGENAKSAYSMSKGALISGTRSLAIELAPKKIRVNCVSPGLIITALNENAEHITDPSKRKALEDKHPLGLGTPVDVASACVYLLSDATRWVTGTNLVVDGGYTAK